MNVAGGELDWIAVLNDSQFQASLRQMDSNVNKTSANIQNQGNQIESFASKAATAAGAFLSIQAATGFIQSMVAVRGEFQQIGIAFTTMLGSKQKADQLMAEAVKLAAITPFTLRDVASGAKQLLAYGFAANDVTKNLTMLGNIASGVGSQLTDVVYLYGTLKASGRVTQMDINQFANRGIPIYEELAKAMGKTTSEVRGLVSAGQVGFPQIEKAFSNMTGQGGRFFNLMQEQSKSLTGQLSNLQDAWDRMLNALGKSQEGILSDGISAAISLVDNYEKVIEVIELLIITYGSYRAALILTNTTMVYSAVVTNAAGVATRAWTVTEILHYNVLVMKSKLLSILTGKQAVLAASTAAYTAVIAALVAVGYSLIQYQDAAELAENSLTEAKEKGARAVENETEKIDGLIKTLKDHSASKREQKVAYDSLLLTTKGVLDKYSQEEIAAGKGAEAIDKYKDSVRKATEASKQFADYKEIQTQLDEINDKGIKAISTYDQAAISITRFGKALLLAFSGNFTELGLMMNKDLAFKAVVDIKKGDLKGAQNTLLENPEVKKLIDAEKLAKQQEENAKKEEANLKLTADQLAKQEAAAKKYNALLEQRKDLEREITQDLAGARAMGMDEEEQKIVSINKKYDDRITQIDKLNAKLKSGDQIDKKPTESSRMLELGVNGVDAIINGKGGYKEELEKKKQLFAEYEQAKTDLGEKLASDMYKDQIGNYINYADYIKKDIESRKGDSSLMATKKNEVAAPILVEQNTAQREADNKLLAESIKNSETLQAKRIFIEDQYLKQKKALEDNASIVDKAERLKQLERWKNEQVDAAIDAENSKSDLAKRLATEALILTRSQIIEQIDQLKTLLKTIELPPEVKANIEKQLGGLEVRLKVGASQSNLDGLKGERSDVISAIAEESKKANPNVLELTKRLTELNKKIKEVDSNGDGKAGGLKSFLNDLKDNKAVKGIAEGMGLASDAAFMMSDAMGGVDTEAGYTLDTIGKLAGAAADVGLAIASGDPAKMIGAAIKAVGTLFSIGKKVKEMNAAARKEVADYYANAIAGEREYQDLLKERELQTIRNNKTALQGIRDEVALRSSQTKEYSKESAEIMAKLQSQTYVSGESYTHGTWFKKASTNKVNSSLAGKSFAELSQLLAQGKLEGDTKALVERLKELEQKGYDAEQAIADLAKETSELFTGTTSDNLTNSLLDMFRSGKTGAQDLADFFKTTMDDAALSIFKNKVLAQAMETFYTEFDKASQSGGELTADEIARLNGLFTSLTGDALKKFEEFKKITGSDLSGNASSSTDSSLKGAITGITAPQADLLAGQFGGMRLAQLETNALLIPIGKTSLELLQVGKSKLDALIKIEQNTYRTANNTERLANMETALISMDKKMINNNAGRAAGF